MKALSFFRFAGELMVPWLLTVYFRILFDLSWFGSVVLMFCIMIFMVLVYSFINLILAVQDKKAKMERERVAAEKLAKSREYLKEIDETLDRMIEKRVNLKK